MNNLHRQLALISDAACAQIEDEASRTLKRHLAGRRWLLSQAGSVFNLTKRFRAA